MPTFVLHAGVDAKEPHVDWNGFPDRPVNLSKAYPALKDRNHTFSVYLDIWTLGSFRLIALLDYAENKSVRTFGILNHKNPKMLIRQLISIGYLPPSSRIYSAIFVPSGRNITRPKVRGFTNFYCLNLGHVLDRVAIIYRIIW